LDGLGVFFFVLFSMARFGLNLGFWDRPLVIGLFWSATTGNWEFAVPAALFFELFFLDLFPIGTFIPPHGPFALLATLAMAHIFEVTQPSWGLVLIMLSMPAALLGSKLEQRHRQWQNFGYTRMLQSTRPGREHSVSAPLLARNALVQMCLVQGLAFVLVMGVLTPFAEWLLPRLQSRVLMMSVSWPHIWMLGTLGALLSFRTRKVYAFFLVMVFIAGLVFGMGYGVL